MNRKTTRSLKGLRLQSLFALAGDACLALTRAQNKLQVHRAVSRLLQIGNRARRARHPLRSVLLRVIRSILAQVRVCSVLLPTSFNLRDLAAINRFNAGTCLYA